MAWPPPQNTPRRPLFGGDPTRLVSCSVAMLLRMGIGLSLLHTGLAGYFNPGRNGGVWGQGPSIAGPGFEPLLSILPYLSIGLGLALILGFMTTLSAILAGFFSLIGPMIGIALMIAQGSINGSSGMARMINDPYLSILTMTSMPGLLNHAALIWLSPIEYHPYSVDALIFAKNEAEPSPETPAEPAGPSVEMEA